MHYGVIVGVVVRQKLFNSLSLQRAENVNIVPVVGNCDRLVIALLLAELQLALHYGFLELSLSLFLGVVRKSNAKVCQTLQLH